MPMTAAAKEKILEAWDANTPETFWDLLADTLSSTGGPAVTVAASGAAVAADASVAKAYKITLTANCTITVTGFTAGQYKELVFFLTQDGTGSRTITFAPVPKAAGATLPVWSTVAGRTDMIKVASSDGGATLDVIASAINLS